MGWLDQLAGLFGRSGDPQSSTLQALVTQVLNNPQIGGLQGLVEKFQSAGLGDVVNSWIGTGPNQPVSPDEVHEALGHEHVDALANQTGIPANQVLALLAQHLPGLVDKLTPEGTIPEGGMLQSALSALGKKPTGA